MKRLIYLSLAALMVLAVSCKKDPKVGTPSVKTLAATEVEAFSARLNAKIDFAGVNWGGVNYGFYWGTSEDPEGTYTMGEGVLSDNGLYAAVITGLAPETEYWFKAFIEIDDVPYTGEILNFTTAVSPIPEEAVDLGIVMTREDGTTYKLYWAKSNLCETGLCPGPESVGDYYSWGETSPKEDYSWSAYKFGTSKNGPFSKYNTNSSYGPADNKTVLDPEDDVACVKLGGKWRMPTRKEWEVLRTQCAWTWTDDYNSTGVAGRIVSGKVEGYKDKSIFLPAAGYWKDDGSLHDKGSYGDYWSSSLNTAAPGEAYLAYFGRNDVSWVYYYRYIGPSVRPVWEE